MIFVYSTCIFSISSICKSKKKNIGTPHGHKTNIISLTIVGMFDLIVIVERHLVVNSSGPPMLLLNQINIL